jgi:putative endonuclease
MGFRGSRVRIPPFRPKPGVTSITSGFFVTFYGYILQSLRTGTFYVGQTKDLTSRLTLHNAGRVLSTRLATPWKLVYYVEFSSRSEAIHWERRTKSMKSRRYLESLIAGPVPPGITDSIVILCGALCCRRLKCLSCHIAWLR